MLRRIIGTPLPLCRSYVALRALAVAVHGALTSGDQSGKRSRYEHVYANAESRC